MLRTLCKPQAEKSLSAGNDLCDDRSALTIKMLINIFESQQSLDVKYSTSYLGDVKIEIER